MPAYFVRLNDDIRGPFGWERLKELAETRVITPETEAAENRAGPWVKFMDIPGCSSLFPERIQFQFKAKSFEQVEPRSAPPVDHRELIAAANRQSPSPAGAGPPVSPRIPNELEEILRLNRAREQQAGLDQLKPLPRAPNRRRRDYLILMILFNGFFIWSLVSGRSNPTVVTSSIAGIVIFSAGLSWIMYGVMDRY
jgi:hypothetical protein